MITSNFKCHSSNFC